MFKLPPEMQKSELAGRVEAAIQLEGVSNLHELALKAGQQRPKWSTRSLLSSMIYLAAATESHATFVDLSRYHEASCARQAKDAQIESANVMRPDRQQPCADLIRLLRSPTEFKRIVKEQVAYLQNNDLDPLLTVSSGSPISAAFGSSRNVKDQRPNGDSTRLIDLALILCKAFSCGIRQYGIRRDEGPRKTEPGAMLKLPQLSKAASHAALDRCVKRAPVTTGIERVEEKSSRLTPAEVHSGK
ncbi:MAG: hypothetical protein AB7G93_16945 [Bdellovibrionales bacterium]